MDAFQRETKIFMLGRVPRGVGVERAVVAVCRHLVRDGTRFVNLVTDESIVDGEKFVENSARSDHQTIEVSGSTLLCTHLVLGKIVGDSSSSSYCRHFACHSVIVGLAPRSYRL